MLLFSRWIIHSVNPALSILRDDRTLPRKIFLMVLDGDRRKDYNNKITLLSSEPGELERTDGGEDGY